MKSKPLSRYIAVAVTIASFLLFRPAIIDVAADGPTDGGVVFTDIAQNEESGLNYQRQPSTRNNIFEAFKQQGIVPATEVVNFPHKARGIPGVALLDFDGDDDLDMYVTNGPGAANSLFSNQLTETGDLTFVDMATLAGVAVQNKDSNGVCFGDIDNDGDHDLLVLNNEAGHALFTYQGDGTFADISTASQIIHLSGAIGCAMGDVNGDGLLDILIGNAFNQQSFLPIFAVPFDLNFPDQLFLNNGDNTFSDVSDTSGIRNLAAIPAGKATITWAVAMVDYDLDGDTDIVLAQDQAGFPTEKYDPLNGIDRGFIHFLQNDGLGNFTDISETVGLVGSNTNFGAWMGLAFADYNCDGRMDFFATNFGDGTTSFFGQFEETDWSSEWFLQNEDGTFASADFGPLQGLPFGWGTSPFDYDNDGDTDIMFHGGIDAATIIDATNAGVILQNNACSGSFSYDAAANPIDHGRRNVQGAAVGDLNNDGFVDIVSASNFDIPETIDLLPTNTIPSGPFQAEAQFVPTWANISETELQWLGLTFPNGTLSVEINSADNGNRWVAVDLMGTKGVTSQGVVNRDGIGAVVTFTPRHAQTAMYPIVSGASHASQNSLTLNIGLGNRVRGTLDILWPGGVRNRLYGVKASEHIVYPEIPCSLDGNWPNKHQYTQCVNDAITELRAADIITQVEARRIRSSANRAFGKP